ncbi:MAG TPA: DUF2089 family protein [Gemmatimonadales bacterium]
MPRWIDRLSDEDLAFLKRFLLSGGTLKDLAAQYNISYPTVRLRLDRLIEKVKLVDAAPDAGPFEQRLRAAYADGRLDAETFRTLLEAHKREQEDRHETRAR